MRVVTMTQYDAMWQSPAGMVVTHGFAYGDYSKQLDHMRVVELAHGCCFLEELDLVTFVVEHLDGHLLHHTSHVLPLPPTHHTKLPLPYLAFLDHRGARDLLVLVLRELSVEVSLIVGWTPVVL